MKKYNHVNDIKHIKVLLDRDAVELLIPLKTKIGESYSDVIRKLAKKRK